ncbi:MAG: DUF389 domain-containing protein [Erysipelotrichaceae bacterium]|nr:DUF389 domain-containing protein [Erysipelotrichaceae bacterium]MDY5252042.1 DUF389 domain-containing protein [Erysipelotrichaceae bacterium]
MNNYKDKIRQIFSLKVDQADNMVIQRRIIEGASVTGTNMYILILAILIASIGLNMNSTAVVIGAMLISPLMGVIISIAYGLAQRDTYLLRQSIQRFLFQVIVSIMTSTLYFLISPLDTFSGELAARTYPTLWDVLIAISGGFAAIIANTRKSTSGNVIPGAAIATALMPPLCTVGYCLANHKWLYALGAFYLFSINVIFIFVASVIGLQLMGVATHADDWLKTKKNKAFLFCFMLIVIIPSGFLAWQSVASTQLEENYRDFLNNEFQFADTQIVKSARDVTNGTINIALIGSTLSAEQIAMIESSLADYNLDNYTLNITQTQLDQSVSKQELAALLEKQQQGQLNQLDLESEVDRLSKLFDLQAKTKEKQQETVKEILILYSQIKHAGFSQWYENSENSAFSLIIEVEDYLDEETLSSLKQWLSLRFEDEIAIVQYIQAPQELPLEIEE